MIVNRNHFIALREREGLISLTALDYIEEHELLAPAQLADAKRSLQALFLRASSEETMLRQLIEALKATRHVQRTFASIAGTLEGAGKSVTAIEEKLAALRAAMERAAIGPEPRAEFFGPFLLYAQEFLRLAARFTQTLWRYLDAREQEARAQSVHTIALEARERLRDRLAGHLGQPTGDTERRLRNEIIASFDCDETAAMLASAQREVRATEQELQRQLREVRAIGCLAAEPSARDPYARLPTQTDIHASFTAALPRHACLGAFSAPVRELFKLFQHSHSVFQLDCLKLRRALDTMLQHPDAYFLAKEEDRDLAAKRERLRRIEALIAFLEEAARLAADEAMDTYPKFSRELSAVISRRASWTPIAGDLLRAKVQAEAELSARL